MAESKSRRWTADELSLLRRLAQNEEPLNSIAAALGRTVIAIRTKAAHERLTLRDDLPSPGPSRNPSPRSATTADER